MAYESIIHHIYCEEHAVYVPRRVSDHVCRLFQHYPVVTITGPRQSGTSTLCRALFPELPYFSL